MAWLRPTISRQERFRRIFTDNNIFLSSCGSAILRTLPLLQIILLRLSVLSLLTGSFYSSLQAALSRHALWIWILGSVRKTQLWRNMLIIYYLLLVLVELLAWNIHRCICLGLIILVECDSMWLPEIRLRSLTMPWLSFSVKLITGQYL